MSTDVTRGPRICPSCGRENAATASHCCFCFISLDQGVQLTPPRPPPAAFSEDSPFTLPGSAASFLTVLLVALLVAVSFVITFVAVCFPVGAMGFSLTQDGSLPYSVYLGIVAGLLVGGLVASLLLWAMTRRRRPW